MKTKCDLKCVHSFIRFNLVLNRVLKQFSFAFSYQLFRHQMPKLRPKRMALNGFKYTSFWFALKAIQNNKILRNNTSITKSLINPNSLLINGFTDENRTTNEVNESNAISGQSSDTNPSEKMGIDSEEQQKNDIKVIEIDTKKSLVLMTNKDSDYELGFGCVRITLLSHNFDLELNGFKLTVNESIELMAAFGHKIAIKLIFKDKDSNIDLNEKLSKLGVQQIDSILTQLKDNSCLILIEKLCLSSLLFLENMTNFKPLNVNSDSVWFELKSVENNSFDYFKVWDKLFNDLNIGENDSIVVCGAQNVGKSSLIRYFINKYLSQKQSDGSNRQCLYLDCDPGQNEFSTSAQISFAKLEKPLLSSTAINVLNNKPLMSCSVGANTASKGPKLYISSVNHLLDYLRNEFQSKGPLFVNTMGWTQDLGLALLTDIIKTTAPTHVIQIDSIINPKINFAFDLTPESVLPFYGFQQNSLKGHRNLDYKLSVIGSDNKVSKRSQLNRVSQQMSYFSQMPEIVFKPFSAMTPFKILWSKVFLHIVSDTSLSPQLYLDTLNCSWVQLCRINEQNHKTFRYKAIRIVDSIDRNQCLGSAVIRGIDFRNKCFYMLSPESPSILESVNCIVRPIGVSIPENILLEQLNRSVTTNLPYIYYKT